jgi:diguanylate cyclase
MTRVSDTMSNAATNASAPPSARNRPGVPAAAPTALDGSADLLRRALPLMSKHAAGYAPHSYALWYEYVRGGNVALRDELDSLLKGGERLSRALTFELHQKHLADRTEETVRKTGAGLLELMSSVRDSVQAATSDASRFDARLAAFGEGLSDAATSALLREQVDSMRGGVGEMGRSLSTLNDQLQASHHEVQRLHSELKRAREEASIDPLTGCVNRRGFDAELIRLGIEATNLGVPLSIVMFDIDHFKKINDSYGHPFGDQVIRAVGQALTALTQRKDVAARYGGEEFALLMPDTPARNAFDAAERIRNAIARGHIKRGATDAAIGNITISAGVAQYVPDEDPCAALERADRALYASKQGGRNRVTIAG